MILTTKLQELAPKMINESLEILKRNKEIREYAENYPPPLGYIASDIFRYTVAVEINGDNWELHYDFKDPMKTTFTWQYISKGQ